MYRDHFKQLYGQDLKEYIIINADCMNVFKFMPENFIDVVVCDPPYETTAYGTSGLGGLFGDTREFSKGKGGFDYNDLDINDYLDELYRVMKPSAHGYLMTNQKNLYKFLDAFKKLENNKNPDKGFSVYKVLVWDKQSKITNKFYMDQHEYIIFFRKGSQKKIVNAGTSSILSFPKIRKPSSNKIKWEKIHPTIKPVDLMRTLIANSTNEGEIVLDFTMGSGSTGVAALSLNRKFVGIQIDQKYYVEAKRRIISFDENKQRGLSPEQALLEDSNRLFFKVNKNNRPILDAEGNRIWYKKK